MSGWHNLVGKFTDYAGTAGTVTLPAGGIVLLVSAHASVANATFQLLGGASVPVINGAATIIYEFDHSFIRATSAANTLVFTNTDHFYVQVYQPTGTSAF